MMMMMPSRSTTTTTTGSLMSFFFFGILLTISISPPTAEARKSLSLLRRHLQDDVKYTHTSWNDCVGMTPSDCQEHILDSVDGTLENHVVPNLHIVISPARTPEVLAKTYWEVGIPTTVDGLVDCSIHSGIIRHPFEWETSEGTFTFPEWDCKGLDITTCCTAIIQDMEDRNIPLIDVQGNCFSCRAHQEPLEPHVDSEHKEGYFLEHIYDESTQTCNLQAYTHAQIQTIDNGVAADLIGVRANIESVLNSSPVLCKDFVALHHSLLSLSRSKPHIMNKIVGMLCGTCDMLHFSDTDVLDTNEEGELDDTFREDLLWIHNELAATTIRSDYANIIIYTDADRTEVLKTPVLGGSRTGIALPNADGADPGPGPGPDAGLEVQPDETVPPAGQCPGATMEDLEEYWEGSVVSGNTVPDVTCSCPTHPGLVEYNHKCYCAGGFKLWDHVTQSCKCPYGHKEGTTECICPSSDENLDWNNVGWIENGQGSCRLDYDCINSDYQYYDDFESGCNKCHPMYITTDEGCELDCSWGYGELVYNKQKDECLCEHYPEMIYKTRDRICVCKMQGAEWDSSQNKCTCPYYMKLTFYWQGGQKVYYCDYV